MEKTVERAYQQDLMQIDEHCQTNDGLTAWGAHESYVCETAYRSLRPGASVSDYEDAKAKVQAEFSHEAANA